MIQLRDYQQAAIDSLRNRYARGARAPLLVAPTGSGKTVLFSHIAQQAAARGKRTLILVHRKELLRQTSNTLTDFDVEHGCIAPRLVGDLTHLVQVASVQTLVRRASKFSWRPDLIVVDEAHHASGRTTWGKILHHYGAGPHDARRTHVLGVTATPQRLDGQGLGVHCGGYFDTMVMGPTVKQLVSRGFLSPPHVYAPSTVDVTGVHTRAGDYAKDEVAEAVDKPRITGDALQHYNRICPGEPAIAFCASVEHANHVAETFMAGGVTSVVLDGKLDDAERARRIRDLGTGTIKVLTSCEIVSEGFDLPVVSAAILLRPTQSVGLYLQQVGRALRIHPGKTRSILLDHVGNTMRHGLPDQDREWSLEARKRAPKRDDEGTVPIRQCEQCYHVHQPAPVCPACGYEYPVNSREIEEVEGELRRIDEEQMRKREERKEQGRAQSVDDLVALGKRRGYRHPRRWAEYVYKARIGKRVATVRRKVAF